MKKAKLIERIAIIAFCCILVLTAGLIPLTSYNSHRDYVKQMEANKPQPVIKAKLTGIEATLREGVKYYANNKAQVKKEDVEVTAVYTKGEETIKESVESEKIEITTPDKFAFEGGDITVSYKAHTAKISVTLEEVKLVELKMTSAPYLVAYKTGDNFVSQGLEVAAVYNDGSEKSLSEENLDFGTLTALKTSDKKITVTYTEKEITKTLDIPVTVADNFENGGVRKIFAKEDAIVEAGKQLSTATATILGEYESGNKLLLSEDDYEINARTEVAEFGKKYEIEATYTQDDSISVKVPVIVRIHIEGENGTLVGGRKNTETEYTITDEGEFVAGNPISFAGGFGNAVKNGNESSASYTYDSQISGYANVTLRCANGNLRNENGYYMAPLQINTVLDITVNGKPYEIADDVILAGIATKNEKYAPLYNVYSVFRFENLPVDAGTNVIKMSFKKSTKNEKNHWGDSPSEFNIDYLEFDCKGTDVSSIGKITGMEFGSLNVGYGVPVDEMNVTVVGVYSNGTKVKLSESEYVVTVDGLKEGQDCFDAGEYVVKVSLVADSSIKIEQKIEIEKPTLLLTPSTAILYEEHKVSSSNYLRKGSMVSKTYDAENDKFNIDKTEEAILGFDWSSTAKNAKDGTKPSVTWKVNAVKGEYTLKMRINNPYVLKDGDDYVMKSYDLANVITLKVNGVEVSFSAMTPTIRSSSRDNLFDYLYEIDLSGVTLKNGENTVCLEGNTASTLKNCWGEVPAPRIAWALLELK